MTLTRFGLIGTGDIVTHAHIPAMQSISSVEIAGVFDVQSKRAKAVAKQFDIPKVFEDVESLITEPSIDAVLVATPNKFHASYAEQALLRGKHVLCEKPVGLTQQEVQLVVDAAEKNGKQVSACFHYRNADEMRWLKELISNSRLGKIRYVHVRSFRRRAIPGLGSWFTQKEFAGGGTFFDNGSHLVDLVMWLTGFPEIATVDCEMQSVHGHLGRGAGAWGVDHFLSGTFDVEDFAHAKFTTREGTLYNIETCWAIHADNEFRVQIVGDHGGVDFNPRLYGIETPMRIFMQDNDDLHTDHSLQYAFPDGTILDACSLAVAGARKSAGSKNMQTQLWNRCMSQFVEAVQGHDTSMALPKELVYVTRLLERAYQAADAKTTKSA